MIVRIYFQTGAELRRFAWCALGSDESVYFGTSGATYPDSAQCGTADVKDGECRIDYSSTGRPMSRDEMEGKYSLHKSGVVLLPQFDRAGGRRVRHIAKKLADYDGAIPLASVVPKRLTLYPTTSRKVQEHDLVLDVTSFLDQPFALMIYLKRPLQSHPKVMTENPDWDVCEHFSVTLGAYDVCAVVYAMKATFVRWQEKQVVCTTGPGLDDGMLEWPIITSSGM